MQVCAYIPAITERYTLSSLSNVLTSDMFSNSQSMLNRTGLPERTACAFFVISILLPHPLQASIYNTIPYIVNKSGRDTQLCTLSA